MPPINPENSLVQIGTADTGPFATIIDLDTYNWDRSRAQGESRKVFGNPAPYVQPGSKDSTYGLAGLYAPSDTDGQNVLEDAYENGTDVWLQVLPDGSDGWAEKCKVTRYAGNGAANDQDFVEVQFELQGDGVITPVVGT